ncbi:MAG: sugar phosphate nucleotidyltransferase [Bacteroidia bacterium]|nr:sugar phosphate nucleotidyltransferase [Bacteroidia bacterium]
MKIIIPMAGMGKRMRPHTLTIPKPLIPIAGKPIVQRLVEEIAGVSKESIEEIAFIIGDFNQEVITKLEEVAGKTGAKARFFTQEKALGTAHAVLCAEAMLDGKIIVAFADTLFKADFTLDCAADAIVWVSRVNDPSAFGVIKMNEDQIVTDFVEKPKTFVSDLAIIGIYYFNDGAQLKKELQYLVDNDMKVNGEFQLTDALENMKNHGTRFRTATVTEWLDCGNKNATVFTNQRILEYHKNEPLISPDAIIQNSVIIEPCYIGEHAEIRNSVIGPYLSIGNNTKINNSLIKNSIIQSNTIIEGLNIENSMVGNFVEIKGEIAEVNIGDFTSIQK